MDAKTLRSQTEHLNVLYVEDDEFLREQTGNLLSKFFAKVDTAANGEEGLHQYQQGTYDIVMTDLHMPVMDGIACCRRIKEINQRQIIIVVSAYDDSKVLMELLNLGIDQFILKPLELQQFMGIVNQVCLRLHDQRMLKKQMEQVQDDPSLHLLEQAVFKFRTLNEAHFLSRMLSKCFPDPEKVLLGLTELLSNAVEHGNLGITFEEKTALLAQGTLDEEIEQRLLMNENQEKYATIQFLKTSNEIKVHIEDRGKGFDYEQYLTLTEERLFLSHGRGIAISKQMVFDDLQYLGCGNSVEAVVRVLN